MPLWIEHNEVALHGLHGQARVCIVSLDQILLVSDPPGPRNFEIIASNCDVLRYDRASVRPLVLNTGQRPRWARCRPAISDSFEGDVALEGTHAFREQQQQNEQQQHVQAAAPAHGGLGHGGWRPSRCCQRPTPTSPSTPTPPRPAPTTPAPSPRPTPAPPPTSPASRPSNAPSAPRPKPSHVDGSVFL